jgi:hypothetical protein
MFRILLVHHQGINKFLLYKTNMKYLQLLFRTTVTFYVTYEVLMVMNMTNILLTSATVH